MEKNLASVKKNLFARVIGISVLAEVGNYLKHSRGRHTETDAVVASANKKFRKGGGKSRNCAFDSKRIPSSIRGLV